MRPSTVTFLMMFTLLAAAGCSSTRLSSSWKDPEVGRISFKKVIVLALNSSPVERRAEEDALVSQIKKTTAVASYTLIPDAELQNREKVKATIRAAGFDGAVVLRLLDRRKEATYIPGSSSYWSGTAGYAPYRYTPGHTVIDTIVVAEVSVYRVSDGRLLWAGSSETTNPASAAELAIEVAHAATADMRKQGMIE